MLGILLFFLGFFVPLLGQDAPKMKKVKVKKPIGMTTVEVEKLKSDISKIMGNLGNDGSRSASSAGDFVDALGRWSSGVSDLFRKVMAILQGMQEEKDAVRNALKLVAERSGVAPGELADVFTKEVEVEVPVATGPGGVPEMPEATEVPEMP